MTTSGVARATVSASVCLSVCLPATAKRNATAMSSARPENLAKTMSVLDLEPVGLECGQKLEQGQVTGQPALDMGKSRRSHVCSTHDRPLCEN